MKNCIKLIRILKEVKYINYSRQKNNIMQLITDINQAPNPGKLDLDSLPWVSCSCGGSIFEPAVMVKKVSSLLSPTGKEEIVPADVIICKTCNKIPAFYAKRVKGLPADLISE